MAILCIDSVDSNRVENDENDETFDETTKLVSDGDIQCSVDERKPVTVDEMLEHIGEYNRGQKIITLMCSLMMFGTELNNYNSMFDVENPAWKCSAVGHLSGECLMNKSIDIGDEFFKKRCEMNRSSWEYVIPKQHTIVTEFDLVCDKEFYPTLVLSLPSVCSIVGTLISGGLAARYGRKPVVFICFTLPLIITVLRAFVVSFEQYFSLTMVSALLSSATDTMIYIIAGELAGPQYRAQAANTVWLVYAVAVTLLGLIVYLVREWRLRAIIIAAPALGCALFWSCMPESIRWLVVNKRTEDAEKVLKRLAKINKKEYPKHLKCINYTDEETDGSMKDLFCNRTYIYPLILHSIFFFIINLLYEGIIYATSYLSGNYYLDYSLVSVVEIPACILIVYLCNRFGRKRAVCCTSFFYLICFIYLAVFPEQSSFTSALSISRSAVGMFAKFFVSMTYDATYLLATETFPTIVRTQAMCFMAIVLLCSSTLSPWISQGLRLVNVWLPFSIMAGLCGVSFFVSFLLKETNGLPTAETIIKSTDDSNSHTTTTSRRDPTQC